MNVQNYDRYKVINRDVIKYVAVFFMFWGHLISWLTLLDNPDNSNAIYNLPVWTNIVTNLSMFCPPVMFFFIADGYKYTRNCKKYALRLFMFACITQLFDYLLFHEKPEQSGNVIFTLFLGLLAIMAWESRFSL